MNKYTISAFCLAALLCSCSDEVQQTDMPETAEYVTLTLSTAPSSRTSLDGYELKWSRNDRVVINGDIYNVTLDEDGNACVDVRKADSYRAFYPACLLESMTDTEINIDLDYYSAQGVGKNKLGDDVLPMYASSKSSHLVFRATQPLVKIHVTGPKRCEEFLIFAKNGQSLNGRFSCDIASGAMTPANELVYPDNYTAVFNANDQFPTKGLDYYFALPTSIGNDLYSEGMFMEIPYRDSDNKSSIYTIEFPANMELHPGTLVEMPEIKVPKVEGDILYSKDNGQTWRKTIPVPMPERLMVKTTGNRCINDDDLGKIMKLADEEGDNFRFELDLSHAANWQTYDTEWVHIYPNYGCANVRSIIFPYNVIRSGTYNYLYFRNLEEITFPPSIMSMHQWIRDTENSKVRTVRMTTPTPPAVCGEKEFYGMGAAVAAADRVVYVPAGSMEAYRNAPGWKDLFEGGKPNVYKFQLKELPADYNPYAD